MIRKSFAAIVCLLWALWLGGLGALFLFVSQLFASDRELAVKSAPLLFQVFEKYQLLLAMAVLAATAAWRIAGKSKRAAALFWMFGSTSAIAAASTLFVTHRMIQMWAQGQSGSPEFMKLHGWSMLLYLTETLLLAVAGMFLPWAFGDKA